MDDLDQFSVLEYARTRGVAKDHSQLDPLDLLAQIHDTELAHISSFPNLTPETFDLETSAWTDKTESVTTRPDEKFELDKSGTKFLASVLKEVSSLQGPADFIPRKESGLFEWPKYNPRNDLKIDVPLLTSEQESEMKTFGKIPDPTTLLNEVIPNLMDQEKTDIDEGLEFPDYFWELSIMFDRDASNEKLEASKDTAIFLQGVIGYLDDKRHREDIEKLFSSVLDIKCFQQRPSSPLYIESADETSLSQGLHNNNADADADMDWNSSTTRLEVSKTPFSTQKEYIETPVNISPKCSSINTSFNMDDARQVSKSPNISNLPHETAQSVEDTIASDLTISPPVNKQANKYADEISKATDLPSPTSNVSIMSSGPLGTLSAFMQTRRQKHKHRKPDKTSRYLTSSTPKNSEKSDQTDKNNTTVEPGKPSSPSEIHEVQTPYQHPRSAWEESTEPFTLFLSTQLLQTERTLVRSLEKISGSRPVRLIFRDYTHHSLSKRGTFNQLHVVEEADLILSPTTGIILSSSHETTQKYLPGQGSAGIESPLKARIVRASSRYEMLYVLIRSPAKICTKTLSSIRDLTAFCTSLNQVCNIKVLLVPADCVVEWILSIAAKHNIPQRMPSPLHEGEGEAPASLYSDSQTQWEIFLRSAGLNPFAAQSILSVLKASSRQIKSANDANELTGLSKFIDMPSKTRREMFQGIIGQRVLERVERALEMDWQVDWAIDIA